MEEKQNKKNTATEYHGQIVDCKGLRIRKNPSLESEVLGVLDVDSDFTINKKESTPEFWKITFDDITGYCVRKFVITKPVKVKTEETEE